MLSTALRCLVGLSSPSNQVISTLNSLPQCSAARLPCAHQVACRPALENAAFNGLPAFPVASTASAGVTPNLPNNAAPPAAAAVLMNVRRLETNALSLPNI